MLTRFVSRLRADSGNAPAESPLLWTLLGWTVRPADTAGATSGSGQITTTSLITTTNTVNVKDYGAVGDGVTDDSAALKAAEAAMTSGSTLYFPEGNYRFAQQNPAGHAAILLKGLSDVTVEFAPGARLLMDNLDASGHGTSHGIRIEGAAANITLLNPDIEWVTRPSARSFGDGISVLGWPSDSPPPSGWSGSTGTVQNVSVINGRVENAPQAGAVFMGCSDVTVTDFTAVGTLADGLHFNANRRVTVDGLTATNTGDDGLAFVTYYDPTQPWTYGPTDGPFNQAGLGEWNNGGSVATHITVTGGRANGFRVQGGYDITISDVTVTDKEFGFHVNSAIASGPGDWTSIASQNIDISDVTISGAQTGIVLATNNIDGTEDSKWWDFSGVTISDVTILGSKNWSLAVETPATTTSKFSGVTLRNIYAETHSADGPFGGGNGGILLASLRDSVIDNVRLVADHPSDIHLFGAGQLRNGLTVAQLPSSNLTVNDLVLQGPGRILIQDIAGVQFGDIASYRADGAAVMLYRVKDASFDSITAYLPGRGAGDGYGVRLLQVAGIEIDDIAVTMDDHVGSSWWAVELSGGNPSESIAGSDVHIHNVTYVSDRDATTPDIGIQGGPYGPADWYISVHWLHQGEATPQWRSWLYGDTSPV
ncbi:glycosyl hydrolase family 28-related protein [Mycobacterium sp. C3-094]